MIKFKTSDSDEFKVEQQKSIEKTTNRLTGSSYKLGEFEDFTNLVPEDVLIWYSFDDRKTNINFHIVPDKNAKIKGSDHTVNDFLNNKACDIKNAIAIQCYKRQGYGYAQNHKYILAHYQEYEYLMLLGRLWCKDNAVNNAFGKIQFMRYPIADEQINLVDGNVEIMYTDSDEDGQYKFKSRHLVYNPVGLSVSSCTEAIANQFMNFINLSALFD